MIDTLTGAYTRAFLQQVFPQRLDDCKKAGRSLALFLMDLDHFKVINDSFGHARGDEALREFADRIRRVLRKGDVLCRYGGDEFVVVAEGLSRDGALALGERMLAAISETPFSGSPPLSVSVSIGVALFPDDAVTVESLLQIADNRHYEAKRQGRARLIGPKHTETVAQARLHTSGRLIERDAQMQTFLAFLEAMPQAKRGVFAVHGERGCGRTRFLQELSKRARLHGYITLRINANEARAQRVYGAFLSAQQRIPKLVNTFLGRHHIAETIQTYVANKQAQGLFITVDGADALDSGSVRSLISLVESDIPLVAIAYAPDTHLMRPLEQRARLQEMVALSPFSRAGLAVWLRHVLLHEPEHTFVEWLFLHSEGKPAVAYALLEQLHLCGLLGFNGQHWVVSPYVTALHLNSPLAQVFLQPSQNTTPLVRKGTFIGRAEELNQLNSHLENHRLISLVGNPGVGKTRLAIQFVNERTARSRARLLFVPIQDLVEPAFLPYALLHALGIQPGGEDAWQQIEQALSEHEWLIVLDGVDNAAGITPLITRLLVLRAHVRLLITACQPLGLPEEFVFPVKPLGVPEEHETLHDLDRFEAILMFIHEARHAYAHFAFGNNWQRWRDIVRCTHGNPLLIRLLAMWVDFHTPEEWQDMLQRCKQLHGVSDTPVLTFLWEQFSPEERTRLQMLAALPVPVSIEVAQACTQATHFFLSALTDRAFLDVFNERLSMPQLFREYVQAQHLDLDHPSSEETLRLLARRGAKVLPAFPHDTDAVRTWAHVVQRDMPFWQWLLLHVDALDDEIPSHVIEQVARWYLLTGNWLEGAELLAHALPHATSPRARAHMQAWRARLLIRAQRPLAALPLLEEAATALHGALLHDALVSRAEALYALGAYEHVHPILHAIEPDGDMWPDTRARFLLLQAKMSKDVEEATHLAQQALTIALKQAAPHLVVAAATWLHVQHRQHGYILPSREWSLQAIQCIEQVGSVRDLAQMYDVAATTLLMWQEYEQAETFYVQAVKHARRAATGAVWLSALLRYLLVLVLQQRWRELVPGLFLFTCYDGFQTCQDTTDRWLAVLIALVVLEHEANDPLYAQVARLRAQIPDAFSDALLQMVNTLLSPLSSSERQVERPEELWPEVATLIERQLFDGVIGAAGQTIV